MQFIETAKKHKAFTLIELLIVIFIVSMVYAIGLSGFKISKPKPKALTPLNLKEVISKAKGFNEKVSLLCLNNCKTCLFRRSISSAYEPYKNGIDLTGVKAYTIDRDDTLSQIEYGRYDDKQVCLKMDFYPNGSSTQIILQNDKSTYFLPAFFDEAKQFDSPEAAQEYWLKNTQLVSGAGDFY